MLKEVRQLIKQNTGEYVPRSKVPLTPTGTHQTNLPGTWVFKLKRLPDGTPSKFKARYCVRGDKQTAGVDCFDIYAPVVTTLTHMRL